MTPEQYQRIGKIFNAALDRPLTERADWLAQNCGDDEFLRAEVEKLLAKHSEAESFLARPALDVAAELLAQNSPPLPNASAAGNKISHYEIVSLLGAGGMGEVYLAVDLRLNRKVALKLLPTRFMQDLEHLRRFKREALAASALNHPNIVTIYEFGGDADRQFIATEFVQGETLRQILMRGQMSIGKALEIAMQIVSALATAHAANIMHRDMKPENIMLRNDGFVKVLDFGLAKLLAKRNGHSNADELVSNSLSMATQLGRVIGTAAYMSPEQARGHIIDERSDLFAVGVMLFEMLTGQHPFISATVNHTIVAILEKESPTLASFGLAAPSELEQILNQLLAKNVMARYQTAHSLLADLKNFARQLDRTAGTSLAVAQSLPDKTVTQPMQVKTLVQSGKLSNVDHKTLPAAQHAQTAGTSTTATPNKRKFIWSAAVLLLAGFVSVPVWQTLRLRPQNNAATITAPTAERTIIYFLTVQRYRNGKPFRTEFQSSGREIFEQEWRFKLNVKSPQEGFLYLLNEEPSGVYSLLFPLPLRNAGSAHIAANQGFQTGAYVFDQQPGTERFRLIWAAQPVPELEALRALLNQTNKGRVTDPAQIQAVRNLIAQHSNSPINSNKDVQNQQTIISGQGSVIVALIELEHR